MLPVNDLGSDSPLYFSLLEHPCAHDLTRMNSPVVAFALWFRAQSRCPQKNDRPCVSVETGTCTNLPRNTARLSAHHWQANRHANGYKYAIRFGDFGFITTDNWRTSLLSPKSAACVLGEVHMLSTSGRHSSITTVLCSAFQMRDSTEGVHSGLSLSGVPVRGQQGKSDQLRSDQLRSDQLRRST